MLAHMDLSLVSRLDEFLEHFLAAWTRNMRAAGYLEHTTAKREDCILSFRWFVDPLLAAVAKGGEPTFSALLRGDPTWAGSLLATAGRHNVRGVTAEMFFGCFKTFLHALEECLTGSDAPLPAKRDALLLIRRFADVYETLLIEQWATLSQAEAGRRVEETNRLLTLEKCKYENILAAISDSVLVVDAQGRVLEANESARRTFGAVPLGERPFWELLGLEGRNLDEVLRFYAVEQAHELGLFDDTLFLEMKLIPLERVSLAAQGLIVVLMDITAHVRQRAVLEQVVRERTEDLEREKAQMEEMNITLRNVLGAIEREREAQRRGVAEVVESVLVPALSQVRRAHSPPVQKAYLDILESQLQKLAPGSGQGRDARMLKLTPTELKICRFIQAGSSSKDIAAALNLSLGTVQTHRKNIRKKLAIQGRDVNLFTCLQEDRPDSVG